MTEQPSADDATAIRAPEDTPTIIVDTSSSHDLQFAPGTILMNRYRMVSLIGRGGMGEVYRADDLKLGQAVALKFLSRRTLADPKREERFYEEIRIGRQISHPNVCRLHDIAEVDGRPFITMEFVDGEDLASLLRRIGRLPHDKALSITRDLCAGLAAAHEAGVIHRDLKPGNIMIDGRGRARITDFGLAIAGPSAAGETAGTPAYMAPEQLAGEPATVLSDIYALGLILYEIFTGRRTFDSKSLPELIERQHERRFARPISVVAEINPQVERVILHALHPDPDGRPRSVEALAAELPHYDPLKAAIAAGETPTPGMVAAAVAKGDLSPAAAWTLLLVVSVGLVLAAALSARTMLHGQIPNMKPPEVMLERAHQVLVDSGLKEARTDSSYDYFVDERYQLNAHEGEVRPGLGASEPGATPQPTVTPIGFLYRQSPRPMVAQNFERRVVSDDPPLLVSGMADVTLDATGRLTQLVVVPPRREAPASGAPAVDWSRFFQHAGVDPSSLLTVRPEWTAPVDSDQKQAWLIARTGSRIETAAFHGQPVWFAVIPPWMERPMLKPKTGGFDLSNGAVLGFFSLAIPITILLLARRNILRGQGDRRGALRLATVFFVALFTSALLRAHHVTLFFDEWLMIVRFIAESAFWSAMLALGYVAVEPLVRRRWPEMLISWTRVLNGQFGDPLVGRDLLIGAAAGLSLVILWHLSALVPTWFGFPASPRERAPSTLGEVRHVVYFFGHSIARGLLGGIAIITFLLLLRAVTRSDRAAAAVALFTMSIRVTAEATGPLPFRMIFGIVAAALTLMLLFRFGFLALASSIYFAFVLGHIPLTLDPSAWYFGRSAVTIVVLAGIASSGFFLSVRGKSFLPRLSFEP